MQTKIQLKAENQIANHANFGNTTGIWDWVNATIPNVAAPKSNGGWQQKNAQLASGNLTYCQNQKNRLNIKYGNEDLHQYRLEGFNRQCGC